MTTILKCSDCGKEPKDPIYGDVPGYTCDGCLCKKFLNTNDDQILGQVVKRFGSKLLRWAEDKLTKPATPKEGK